MKIFCTLGNDDYDFGPYTVNFTTGNTNASFHITINDDSLLESTKTFHLFVDSSTLPNNILISDPGQASVILLDDDSKYDNI